MMSFVFGLMLGTAEGSTSQTDGIITHWDSNIVNDSESDNGNEWVTEESTNAQIPKGKKRLRNTFFILGGVSIVYTVTSVVTSAYALTVTGLSVAELRNVDPSQYYGLRNGLIITSITSVGFTLGGLKIHLTESKVSKHITEENDK